jgi:hypothetical protein
MKILEGPCLDLDNWTTKARCKTKDCQSLLEITKEDIKIGEFGGAYCESGDIKRYVECPNCGKCIIIENLPSRILQYVEKNKRKKV